MRVKVGNKIYDGEKEPVMIIISDGERQQITNMDTGCTKYCVYPSESKWVDNDYEAIRKWMNDGC